MIKFLSVVALMLPMSMAVNQVSANSDRWYTPEQQQKGEQVFKQNCAVCHGQNAEATPNWKERDENGFFPPPPLDGTAHAWHHDLKVLRRSVREGGQDLGGIMPAFKTILNDEQVDQAIAYFQSKWPDDLYNKWSERFIESSQELPSLDDIVNANNRLQITKYLRQQMPQANISQPNKTSIDGVWSVKVQNQTVYLINDGKQAFIGSFLDLENGVNLSQPQ